MGAGQLYYTVPVVLTATMTDGSAQTFAGCYTFHLGRPSIQAEPPFHPMGIRAASIQEVASGGDQVDLLLNACQGQGARSSSPAGEQSVPSSGTRDGSRYLDDCSSPEQVLR